MKNEVFVGSIQTRMIGRHCPKCGRTAEGGSAFDIGQEAPKDPKPGDYAVCLYCATLNRYGNDLKLHSLTKRDHRAILRDPRLREMLEIAASVAQKMRQKWQ